MPEDFAQLADEAACRRFEADWFAGHRRPLEHYLPAENASNYLPTLEELIHIELELAWEQAQSAESLPTADAPDSNFPAAIENYLVRFPQIQSEALLLRLVRQEYSVRLRCGDRPTPEEYRRRFPDLPLAAEALDTRLLSHCRERTQVNRFNKSSDEGLLASPGRCFGQYELLEIIGRGGMGVVYRARQREAQRDVALKVIRLSALEELPDGQFNSIASRFRTEALAAARLQHENIVGVHDVGEFEGRPYYAMRLVEGQSLAELTRSGPLENRRAATWLEGAARALDYAHGQGVLHRDVKPQNILIDARTDRPLVTDFGVARLLQDSQSVTRSGELVGTPSYMAPEQIDNAGHAGPDSDVYSLGATLYHLLTGRPPFLAASITDTLWQVKQREPVAPRHLNAAVDRDLDTICLKCLQKERTRRYATAKDLADDLRRYLDHRPILARPIGPVERIERWTRRNPVAARWLMAAAGIFLALLVVGAAGYLSTVAALSKSRRSFQYAQEAVNDLHTAVSENDLLNQPGMQPLRQTLLRRALDYYQKFLEEQKGDLSIARELASASYRAGKITEELESPEKSLAYYNDARELQQTLLSNNPADAGLLDDLSDTLNARGAALRKLQRLDDAAADLQEATRLREKLVHLAPDQFEYQRKLANSYMNLGIVAAAGGDLAAARRHAAQGQAIRNRLLQVEADPRLLVDSGKEHYNLAKLARMENRWNEAEQELQAAIISFLNVREALPDDLENRSRLAASYRVLGSVLCRNGDEAKKAAGYSAYQSALETIESLANENPRVVAYQSEFAAIHMDLAGFFQDEERRDEALAALETAKRILEPLAPKEPRYRGDFAVVLREIASAQLAANQFESARTNLTQALTCLRDLAAAFPDDAGIQRDLTEAERLMVGLEKHFAE